MRSVEASSTSIQAQSASIFPFHFADSTKAAIAPFNILEPEWLQITFFPCPSKVEQRRLLIVVFPFVPQTTKIFSRTSAAISVRISGSIVSAILPDQVSPCFPNNLHTKPVSFEAHMANNLRIFTVFLHLVLFSYLRCYYI